MSCDFMRECWDCYGRWSNATSQEEISVITTENLLETEVIFHTEYWWLLLRPLWTWVTEDWWWIFMMFLKCEEVKFWCWYLLWSLDYTNPNFCHKYIRWRLNERSANIFPCEWSVYDRNCCMSYDDVYLMSPYLMYKPQMISCCLWAMIFDESRLLWIWCCEFEFNPGTLLGHPSAFCKGSFMSS